MQSFKMVKKISVIVISVLMLTFSVSTVFAYDNNQDVKSTTENVITTSTSQNPTLNMSFGSVVLRENGSNLQYKYGANDWVTYSNGITLNTTSQTQNTISVESGTHNITLNNVNIDVSSTGHSSQDGKCALEIKNNAKVNLTLASNSKNTLKSGYYRAGVEVEKTSSASPSVNIIGSGSLITVGGSHSAGIGGGASGNASNITICDHANVTATPGTTNGASYGAGIGGGNSGTGGIILITDNATVIANGGTHGASIGSGADANNGGKITINKNATVTANGDVHAPDGSGYGAGIGGGTGSSSGEITISDNAVVSAVGGSHGAGIGGGNAGDCDKITITDNAKVSSTVSENPNEHSSYGAAIGGGNAGNGGNITISDSATVTAIGGTHGAGIGSGVNGQSGTIAIGEKTNVIATGGIYSKQAIDGSVTAPSNEKPSNILQLKYRQTVNANKETVVLDGQKEVISCSPSNQYKSIAFSGMDLYINYTVKLDGTVQQNDMSSEFPLTMSGLVTYNILN